MNSANPNQNATEQPAVPLVVPARQLSPDEVKAALPKFMRELVIRNIPKADAVTKIKAEAAAHNYQLSDSRAEAYYNAAIEPWRECFPTYEDIHSVNEPEFIIKGILNQGEILANGALPKHGKTWIQLSMAKAMLRGEPWLGEFETKRSERVVYLIPECGIHQIKRRLVLMRMMEFVQEGRLFIQPRPAPGSDWSFDGLTDTKLLKACEGADVFLDTAVRFIKGDESVESIKKFSNECLDISCVARGLVAAHHSTKAFEQATQITMQAVLRGSSDFGAMISTCIGIRQLDQETNLLHVEVCASRDDDGCIAPFHVQGRPYINETGDLKLVLKDAGDLGEHMAKQKGRPAKCSPEQLEEIQKLRAQGCSIREIAERVGISKSTIFGWLGVSGKCPETFSDSGTTGRI